MATSSDLVLAQHEQFNLDLRHAKVAAGSKIYKDVGTVEKAMVVITLGRQLGLNPAQSLTGIHMMDGKPVVGGNLLATFVRERQNIRYALVQHDNDACEGHFFERAQGGQHREGWLRHAEPCPVKDGREGDVGQDECVCDPSFQREGEVFLGRSRFDEADVQRAHLDGTTSTGKDKNHALYPRNMKFNRMVSNGVKWHCPEATGGIPVYTDGEIPRGVLNGGEDEGLATEAQVSLSKAAEGIPAALHDRFYAMYSEASHWRPGTLTPAGVMMYTRGVDEDGIVEWIEREEDRTAKLQGVTDADEVVDAVPVDETSAPENTPGVVDAGGATGQGMDAQDATGRPAQQPPLDVATGQLEATQNRLSDLYDRRDDEDTHLSDREESELADEIAMVEKDFVALGGVLPE